MYWVGWFYEKLKQTESISLFGWHWDKSENPTPEKGTSILYYLVIVILALGMICMGELSENPNSGPNSAIAKWYDKEAVVLETE